MTISYVLWAYAGCCNGNGEKLSSSQAEPRQEIKSAVALFPFITCATSCVRPEYLGLLWDLKSYGTLIKTFVKVRLSTLENSFDPT